MPREFLNTVVPETKVKDEWLKAWLEGNRLFPQANSGILIFLLDEILKEDFSVFPQGRLKDLFLSEE